MARTVDLPLELPALRPQLRLPLLHLLLRVRRRRPSEHPAEHGKEKRARTGQCCGRAGRKGGKRWERLTWAVFRAARLADGRLLFTEAPARRRTSRAARALRGRTSLAAMASLRGRGKSGGRAGAGGGGRGRGNAAKDDETFGGGDEKSDEPPSLTPRRPEGYHEGVRVVAQFGVAAGRRRHEAQDLRGQAGLGSARPRTPRPLRRRWSRSRRRCPRRRRASFASRAAEFRRRLSYYGISRYIRTSWSSFGKPNCCSASTTRRPARFESARRWAIVRMTAALPGSRR